MTNNSIEDLVPINSTIKLDSFELRFAELNWTEINFVGLNWTETNYPEINIYNAL